MKNKNNLIIITFTILISLSFCCITGSIAVEREKNNQPKMKPTPTVHQIDNQDAFDKCKEYVLDNLKSPSTAEFMREYQWKQDENGDWIIIGKVDAQNGFGAMIRSDFMCVMNEDLSEEKGVIID